MKTVYPNTDILGHAPFSIRKLSFRGFPADFTVSLISFNFTQLLLLFKSVDWKPLIERNFDCYWAWQWTFININSSGSEKRYVAYNIDQYSIPGVKETGGRTSQPYIRFSILSHSISDRLVFAFSQNCHQSTWAWSLWNIASTWLFTCFFSPSNWCN